MTSRDDGCRRIDDGLACPLMLQIFANLELADTVALSKDCAKMDSALGNRSANSGPTVAIVDVTI